MPVSLTLVVGSLFSFLAGTLYFAVGRVSAKRHAPGEAALALRAFTTWWYGLGGVSIAGGFISLGGAVGVLDVPLLLAFTFAAFAMICVCLWGLMYYLLYLFFGTRRLSVPLTLFYVAYYFALVYLIVWGHPQAIEMHRWTIAFDYEREFRGPLQMTVLALLVVPQMVGALVYFSLFFRTDSPLQRFRIALVSWSIFLWFGASLAAGAAGVSDSDAWQLASRFVGILAASVILFAYRPPAALRRRLEHAAPGASA